MPTGDVALSGPVVVEFDPTTGCYQATTVSDRNLDDALYELLHRLIESGVLESASSVDRGEDQVAIGSGGWYTFRLGNFKLPEGSDGNADLIAEALTDHLNSQVMADY